MVSASHQTRHTRAGTRLAASAPLLLALTLAGCGSEPGALPPVTGLPTTTGVADPATTAPSVPSIVLVIPEAGYQESNVWAQVFRVESSRHDVITDVVVSALGKQADTVRTLLDKSYSVLALAPDRDDPALPQALADLRKSGLPVILLDQPVEVAGEKLPLVTFESFEDDAREIVDAAKADAAKAGFPPTGPATILVNGPYDEGGRARIAALRKAVEDAGIELLADTVFTGYGKEGTEAVKSLLEKHPDVAIIIADEDQGARSAVPVREEIEPGKRRFIVAAVGVGKELDRMAESNLFAALLQRKPEAEAAAAFRLALARARGDTVPDKTEVKTTLLRATGEPTLNPFRNPNRNSPIDPGVPLKEIQK